MPELTEYALTNKLAPGDEVYEGIYTLLEEHTFSWMVDAWKQSPRREAITFEECAAPQITRRPEWSDERYSETIAACERLRNEHVKLHINGALCLVTKNVSQQIELLLRR